MAKKHLLYIHSEQFRDEKNKSQLVNRLLEEHYSAGSLRKAPEVPPVFQEEPRVVQTESPLELKAAGLQKRTGVEHYVDRGSIYAIIDGQPKLVQ